MHHEEVPPSVDLFESMRSVGYSLEAAVADLVDNSIAAHATHVQIDADVVGGRYIAILDDGQGMSPEVAREALRLAGSIRERTGADLGRFGLGLKTASLSQARCLTVVSSQAGQVTGLRWDLDHVRESRTWSLLVLEESSMTNLPLWNDFRARTSGTLVLWNELDLLTGDSANPASFLADRLDGLRSSLGLVFHRYLRPGASGFAISVNGIDVTAQDPFLTNNPKTQTSPTESIEIGGATVEVTAYTLPHPSGLSKLERLRPDLGDGMRDAQGFYVYRNRRLISHGHWYGLARVGELTKQTRIRVDVPSSLDKLWQLDIKKSRAEPPWSFKMRLRRLIEPMLAKGKRVHTFRGRAAPDDETNYLWSKVKDREGFRYEVNLENPAVVAVLAQLDSGDADRVARLLKAIADRYPLLDAYQEMAGNSLPHRSEPDSTAVEERLREVRDSGVLGDDARAAWAVLRSAEPFVTVPDLEVIVARLWEENKDAH